MKKKILYVLLAITLALVGAFGTTVNGVTAAERDDALPVTGYELIINESSGLSESDFEVKIIFEEPASSRNYSDTQTITLELYYYGGLIAQYSQTVWWQWDYTYVMAWNRSSSASVGQYGGCRSYYLGEIDGYGYNYASYVECMSKGRFQIRDIGSGELVATVDITIVAGYGADGGYWII